jgi:hypothetical protein
MTTNEAMRKDRARTINLVVFDICISQFGGDTAGSSPFYLVSMP